MKILLVNPPWSYRQLFAHDIYPPMGLATIASIIRQNGHRVEILDGNAEKLSTDEMVAKTLSKDFDLLGITSFLDSYPFLKEYLNRVSKEIASNSIIIGGPLISSAPEEILKCVKADYALIGESEISIIKLINALENKSSMDEVPGIYYKQGKNIKINSYRKPIDNLDIIPFPAWDLFPINLYLNGSNNNQLFSLFNGTGPYLPIMMSRGCPYFCNFCMVPKIFPGMRERSPQNIISELKWLVDKFKIKAVYIRDDVFAISYERCREICNLIKKSDLGLKWACTTRVDLVDSSILMMMKEAGCTDIRYGIEALDNNILINNNKGISEEKIIETIKMTKEHGINAHGFFLVGLPGESKESLKKLISFILDSGISSTTSVVFPIPNTSLFYFAVRRGLIRNIEKYLINVSQALSNSNTTAPLVPVNLTGIPDNVLMNTVEIANDLNSEGKTQEEQKLIKQNALDFIECLNSHN